MSSPVIEVVDVIKQIGPRRILDQISLHVAAGEVVGFIGPNGAGKTTLLRILSGMARATSGTVQVCGHTLDGRGAAPPDLGLVAEVSGFVEHLSGVENLRLLASIRGVITLADVQDAIALCGLNPDDKRPVSKYSLGMRQRLSLAQAIMERPRALLLDEPTNGLDVMGIADLRTIIRQQAAAGVGVLLASHLLSEVERACDRVLIVDAGCIRRALSTADLRHTANRVRVGVSSEHDWQTLSTAFEAERITGTDGISGVVNTNLSIPDLNRQLVALDINVEDLGQYTTSLEQAFMQQIEVHTS